MRPDKVTIGRERNGAESTLLPPFSRYSHSMVPGGLLVTS